MQFTHIRHASHIIGYNNLKILVDPVLAKKNTYPPIPSKNSDEKNPLTEMPFSLDFLKDIDAVLISHLHNDHFDEFAKEILDKEMPIICHSQYADKIKTFGFKNIHDITNESIVFKDIKISVSYGRHGYSKTAIKMGKVTGFVLEDISEIKHEPTIYIVGDSVWCQQIETTLEVYKPDIVVVYAGEARIGRSKPITMSTGDIDNIAVACKDSQIIVIHMEAWNHCFLTKKALFSFLDNRIYKNRILIPENGETIHFRR